MKRRGSGPKITIQQILNMLSAVPTESLSIKDILFEFEKIKIFVKETAVYHRIHRLEAAGLIQKKIVSRNVKSVGGRGCYEHFLTKAGEQERDKLNTENPQPPKPYPAKETSEVILKTGIRSIGDYLQSPIIRSLK